MEQQQLLHADYLDIIFDHRNKRYGGYELRKHYPQRARRASTIVLLATCVAFALPVIAANFTDHKSIALIDHGPTILTSIDHTPEKPKEIIPPKKTDPPAPVKTMAWVEPKVVVDADVIQPIKPIDSLAKAAIGVNNNPGDPEGLVADVNQPLGHGKELVEDNTNKGTASEIATYVDQPPVFNGDIKQFLNEHLRYPEEAREAGREGRVVVKFVVNEDGAITDVNVVKSADHDLNEEAVRVVGSMPKWKAGKLNGRTVKTYFMLPISFVLD